LGLPTSEVTEILKHLLWKLEERQLNDLLSWLSSGMLHCVIW
jgi:hypothetical protein